MAGKIAWARLRFLLIALLSSALSMHGCTEDSPTPQENDSESPSQADEDDSNDEESEDDDGKPAATVDAGTKPKPDAAAADAKISTGPKGDAGDTSVEVKSDASAEGTTDAGEEGTADAGKGDANAAGDLGKGDGKDVITIGDSWMYYLANGGGIERGLRDASGQKYRNYGVTGVELLDNNLFGSAIPTQYDKAKKENPDIKTVVMTGGGNDLLMLAVGDAKAKIDEVGIRLDELWKQMASEGVKDVLYIEYSEGGSASDAANVRYGIEKVRPICESQTGLRCHFMLSDPIINKQLYLGDGLNVHPTQDGCTKLGKAAFELMVSEGMRR